MLQDSSKGNWKRTVSLKNVIPSDFSIPNPYHILKFFCHREFVCKDWLGIQEPIPSVLLSGNVLWKAFIYFCVWKERVSKAALGFRPISKECSNLPLACKVDEKKEKKFLFWVKWHCSLNVLTGVKFYCKNIRVF